MNWNLWRHPFNSYMFLWMALGLFLLTILRTVGALSSRERDRWVSHTFQVLQNLERCEASVVSARSHFSDLSSTANRAEPGKAAETDLATAREAIERLLELNADNPRQGVRVRVLSSLTDQFSSLIRAQVQAPPLMVLPPWNLMSDLPVAETVSAIRKEEEALLDGRLKQREAADTAFWLITGIVHAVNLLLIWWAYDASRRYVREQYDTEYEIRDLNSRLAHQVGAIHTLNSSLEDRVAEKTRQLDSMVAKLQATNLHLERFAYMAAHNMQEPLRQVASFNTLLELKYRDQLDANATRYIEYSVEGAKRLQLMLRGLMSYAAITPASIDCAEIPVQSMMQSILEELQAEVQESGAIVRIQASEGMTIRGDPRMIRTVALELVSNAVKFGQNEVPPEVEVTLERDPEEWRMTVADNGIGIEERFVPAMFDMFTRFHAVGERAGAGVGLTLARRIVDCHEGNLGVRPNPSGRGSVFTVTIPILPEEGRKES